MEEATNKDKLKYEPNEEEQVILKATYKDIEDMVAERNLERRQFNDRTLIQFIDDSEKRVQGYVPSRESQDKEDWQSNVFNQTTRNKLKASIAAVASEPPGIKFRAVSMDDGGQDLKRAEVMENLVKHSRYKSNPETEIFWEAWECATKGTVIKYDGYLKTKIKRKFINSYDYVTGKMEFEEKEVVVNDECIDVLVPIQELYIWDFKIHDIQDQSKLSWIRYVDKEVVKEEFGHYKNWKYIKDRTNFKVTESSEETFFNEGWKQRVDDDEYEVIKYYDKSQDVYRILVNGVLLLDVPLLWGRKAKVYPFSKTIFEPFSSKEFFYGNSLPNANMDAQDSINSFYNMAHDKTYRSMNPQRLVGTVNKDLVEMEDEGSGMESTLYLQDINQVKYMDVPGLNNSEMAMIQWVSKTMDQGTVGDNQQGLVGSKGTTAREIVIANENAKKIKGLFFMFLTDLWVQKTRIRILNVLTNYTSPKTEEILGPNGETIFRESFRTFNVENSEFPDGSKGTLAVQVVGDKSKMPNSSELAIEEEYNSIKSGKRYNKMVIMQDYLDDFDYDVQVIPESIYQKDTAEAQALIEQKLKVIATMFPEKFLANQGILFDDFVRAYNESPEKYAEAMPPQPEMGPEGTEQPIEGGGGQSPTPNQGQGTDELLDLKNTLSNIK